MFNEMRERGRDNEQIMSYGGKIIFFQYTCSCHFLILQLINNNCLKETHLYRTDLHPSVLQYRLYCTRVYTLYSIVQRKVVCVCIVLCILGRPVRCLIHVVVLGITLYVCILCVIMCWMCWLALGLNWSNWIEPRSRLGKDLLFANLTNNTRI